MPESLRDTFESRRPLLVHAAQYLTEQLREILRHAGIAAPASVDVDTATEFLQRVQKREETAGIALVDIIEQIHARIAFPSPDLIPGIEPSIAKNLTIVRKAWSNVAGSLPELHLQCVIPPQAKPDGWRARDDLPNLFALVLCVQALADTAGEPILRLKAASDDGKKSRALIMKGGGIKGLAYVGALEELSRKYTFDWFIGTSAGAVAAVLLAAGYTIEQLTRILGEKNFADFFDASWPRAGWNLLVHRGFYKAEALTAWIDTLLASKLNMPTRVKLSDLPSRVTLFASQRDKSAMRFDSHDHDADAAFAVRCSMSIPFVFVPQTNQGIRTYDGGIQHNYPVDELLRTYPRTQFISLYLGPEIYEPVREGAVFWDLVSIWTEAHDAEALSKYKEHTVLIDTRPIGTLDFGLTAQEKEYLLACGKAGALALLANGDPSHLKAKETRDQLKQDVTAARQAKRRRRRRRFFLVIAALIILLVAWVLWPIPWVSIWGWFRTAP